MAMLNLFLPDRGEQPLEVLCIGAHSDDIEIGCGGSILTLLERQAPVNVSWVVLGASGRRIDEAYESARRFLSGANRRTVSVKGFKDSFFPYTGVEIKQYFEELKRITAPDVIFTHCRQDLHQDHRLVSELTWNTFRNHFILEYEIVKYDGDLGAPNCFFHLTKRVAQLKTKHLLDVFSTQSNRDWFTENAFMSLMRIRGIESNASDEYAEGFHCRKIVIGSGERYF
jgi:LmbE family N-acetylglucosaminyl deacetylase